MFRQLIVVVFVSCITLGTQAAQINGWLNWRGPHQNSTSDEKNLPDTWTPGAENNLWTADVYGQSTPVVANGRLYVMGYTGDGADMQEGLYCLDAETGKVLWSHLYTDFLSDVIYIRYASSSPSIDPETGNVYMQGTQGMLACLSPDGKLLWQHSLMEEMGWMTFPNARTSSPVIDGNLVVTADLTTNWGAQGPPADRFYAFDKKTGEFVWASQPGEKPKDSCVSTPLFGWWQGKRVFWAGGGDGSVCCVNARTGDPLWRYQTTIGGVNASVLSYKDTIIAVHGTENLDSSAIGRMISLRAPEKLPAPSEPGKTPLLGKDSEAWRNNLCAFTASPCLVGNRVYLVDETAHLNSIDADTGKILWTRELGIEQRTSSPVYGDGKLYMPIMDGDFYIARPSDAGCEILSKQKLEGRCFGSPAVWKGRVYLQTTAKLYCIGKAQPGEAPPEAAEEPAPKPGEVARYLVIPNEILIRPGQSQNFRLIALDANGHWLPGEVPAASAKWERFIPPTAKVKAQLNGDFTPEGAFKADPKNVPSAGAIKATIGNHFGIARGRIIPELPIKEDFESYVLQPDETNPNVKFAYPPLTWIGARFKWIIGEKNGNKCLIKTVDNKILQRSYAFVGMSDMSNYTVQADVMSDGVIRKVGAKEKIAKMSEVGVINQRYAIILKGSFQQMEVNSNIERLQVFVPFAWRPNEWYTIKARVDVDPATGSGIVRGKAWKKGEPEPEKWTIEVPHKIAHKNGSPGFFGFSPTDQPCYIDNYAVTPN